MVLGVGRFSLSTITNNGCDNEGVLWLSIDSRSKPVALETFIPHFLA